MCIRDRNRDNSESRKCCTKSRKKRIERLSDSRVTITRGVCSVSRVEEYIKVRKNQLQEDMKKAHDDHDVAWYNRLIQELDWVHQMESKPTRNCYMEGKENGN